MAKIIPFLKNKTRFYLFKRPLAPPPPPTPVCPGKCRHTPCLKAVVILTITSKYKQHHIHPREFDVVCDKIG